jgi:hypothetical protein
VSSSLRKRIDTVRATAVGSGYNLESSSDERPTIIEIWLWKLEDAVKSIVKYPHRLNRAEPEGDEYDPCFLYAHRDVLKTEEDVENASDDVLLESLGLANVESWGWLQFMVRDFNWVELLAANWGLPSLASAFGGRNESLSPTEDERRARAAFYCIDLMRERGVDVLALLRAQAQAYKEKHSIDEEVFLRVLCEHDEWSYFVYTCESIIFRPEALGEAGKCLYTGDSRGQFLNNIRRAATRRRRLAGVVEQP